MNVRNKAYMSFEELMKQNHVSRKLSNFFSWRISKKQYRKYCATLMEIYSNWLHLKNKLFEKWENQFDKSDPIWNDPVWDYPILFEFTTTKEATQAFKQACTEITKLTFGHEWKSQAEFSMYKKWAELLASKMPLDAKMIVLRDKAFNPCPPDRKIFEQNVLQHKKSIISIYGISTWWIAFYSNELKIQSFVNSMCYWVMDPNTTQVSYQ